MSSLGGRAGVLLVLAVLVLSVAALGLGFFDLSRGPSTVTTTSTATTVSIQTTTVAVTSPAARTQTALGTATAVGKFDQATVSLQGFSQNFTVAQALSTIQTRLERTVSDLASQGLNDVQSALGSFTVTPVTVIANGTVGKAVNVAQSLTLVLSPSHPSDLDGQVSTAAQTLIADGLLSPAASNSADVSLQLSDSQVSQLASLAFGTAAANATSAATAAAKSQGLKVLGVVSVAEVGPPQVSSTTTQLASFPPPAVQAAVSVTVAVTVSVG